jgi:glycosyltransferase involved in cell wall biosynthesis
MKVLFVTRGFPSEADPMSGNYEAVQAMALAAKGCRVSVIALHVKPFYHLKSWKSLSHRIVGDINVYEGFYPSFSIRFIGRINKHLRKNAYKQAFERCAKDQGRPDIVHAHIIDMASSAIFYKERYQIPFVITEHWTKTNVEQIPDWLKRMSGAYHQADKVICVSKALADSLKRNFQIDSIVINNMVSNVFFQSTKKDRKDNCFRFIACGAIRNNGNKGFDILVDAFAKGHFHQNVTLDIIGDGEDRPFIEKKITQNGMSDQIHLLGVKSPDEVSELLCNSDCFVLSSRLETFAIVVIEAMAKGLPVVATRCGGPETFLLPEHGILVEKENVEQLTDAMKQMIETHSSYDGEKIKKYCHDNFSQDVIAHKIIDVYKQVLSENSQNIVHSER